MHLDIPNIPFAGCAVDCIGILPTTTKVHKFALIIVCLLTSCVICSTTKNKDSRSYDGIPKRNITKNIMQLIHFTG